LPRRAELVAARAGFAEYTVAAAPPRSIPSAKCQDRPPVAPKLPFDPTKLVDRPIWLITSAAGGRRGGLVATWVMPASLDSAPPRLLVAFGPNHFTTELVLSGGAFAAHLLRSDQARVAWNFASDSGRNRDKLTGLDLQPGVTGVPILADCRAWCECRVEASYSTGDRMFVWGNVIAGDNVIAGNNVIAGDENGPAGVPLTESVFFSNLTTEERQTLAAQQRADAALLAPRFATWSRSVQP
jgi:flavin reductase (DIM6/NTAB) family NADH-FMN oxidoreductase RutF